MQILLASAKTMTATSTVKSNIVGTPLFQEEANRHVSQLIQLSQEELQSLLKCNAQIAAQNRKRYITFFDDADGKLPAILAYTGMVFKHLKATDFSEADFEFANKHLWITSFLYGLLRPMDQIKNYRLEGNVKLPDNDGKSMFAYWKPLLTDALIDSVKKDDGILMDLAPEEMTFLFDWERVKREVHVIEPKFYVQKGDKLKIVTVYAKMLRGEMTRFILKNKIQHPEDLKSFRYEGYAFQKENEENTSLSEWLFVLP